MIKSPRDTQTLDTLLYSTPYAPDAKSQPMFKVFEVDAIQMTCHLLAKIMSVYPRGGAEPPAMSFCSTCSLRVNNENVMARILGYDIDFMRTQAGSSAPLGKGCS